MKYARVSIEREAESGEGADFLDVFVRGVRTSVDKDAGADSVGRFESDGEEGVFVCGFGVPGVRDAGYEVGFGEQGAGPRDAEEGGCCV